MTDRIEYRAALAERFDPAQEKTYKREWKDRSGTPRSMSFTFVPDEAVMDRLDDALGLGNWSIMVDPMGERACRVTLRVKLDDEWIEYQDFGYANRDDSAEPLKEASGDGLRRAARYIGVARYVYAGEAPAQRDTSNDLRNPPQTPQNAPQRPQPAAVAPLPEPVRVTAATRPVEEEVWPEEYTDTRPPVEMFPPIMAAAPGDRCEEHNLDWRGEPGDLYHRIPNGGYHRHPGNTPRARVRP